MISQISPELQRIRQQLQFYAECLRAVRAKTEFIAGQPSVVTAHILSFELEDGFRVLDTLGLLVMPHVNSLREQKIEMDKKLAEAEESLSDITLPVFVNSLEERIKQYEIYARYFSDLEGEELVDMMMIRDGIGALVAYLSQRVDVSSYQGRIDQMDQAVKKTYKTIRPQVDSIIVDYRNRLLISPLRSWWYLDQTTEDRNDMPTSGVGMPDRP